MIMGFKDPIEIPFISFLKNDFKQENETMNTTNATTTSITHAFLKTISFTDLHFVVLFWIIAIILQEIRQVKFLFCSKIF